MSSGKRIATMIRGMIVIVIGFFGGFFQIFWIDTSNTGTLLFYMLVVPMVSFFVGAGIMIYGMKDSMPMRGFGLFGMMGAQNAEAPKEKTFIHVPPQKCNQCRASLSSEDIEWVGPLSIRCPYCGATHATEKREV